MTQRLFNPFTREFRENPYKLYASLQQSPPEYSLGMWILTRYADVMAVLRNPAFSSALVPQVIEKRQAEFSLSCPEIGELGRKSIVFTDNPDHARLRRLTNQVFSSDYTAVVLKPLICQLASSLCDQIAEQSATDLVSGLAEPLPLRTLTLWMGLPDSAAQNMRKWTNEVRFFLEPGVVSKRRFQDSYRSLLEFMAFFRNEIQKRKGRTDGDFIEKLLGARSNDDALSHDEVIYACIMAFVAGLETTKAMLGNATLLFARYPEQLQLMHTGRVSIQQAANELFRCESPLQMTKRLCLEDISIAGVQMTRGDQVLLCIGAANHDATIFPEPHTLLLDRDNSDKHIAFGYGFHSCLGAHLAQLQLEAYLDEIASRRITFSVAANPEWLDHTLILRGLKQLYVAVQTVAVGV